MGMQVCRRGPLILVSRRVTNGFLPLCVLLLCLVAQLERSPAQSESILDIRRTDGRSIRLSWPVTVDYWILESTGDLSAPGSWMIEWSPPSRIARSWTLDLEAAGQRHFFRLCTSSIVFVDASSQSAGDGSFARPFRKISLAVDSARERFLASRTAQTVYVMAGEYNESVIVNGAGIPNYMITFLDSSTAIGVNSGTIGGKPAATANLTGSAGMPALMVRDVAEFRIRGYNIAGADGVNGSPATAALRLSNVAMATVQGSRLIGGTGTAGRDGSVAGDGGAGGTGGAGVFLDGNSVLNVTQGSSLTGGTGGDGGDSSGGSFAGDSGLGGAGIFSMDAGNVINITNSTSTGGPSGMTGVGEIGIFLGGFSGNGILLDDSATVTVSHSTIAGGDARAGNSDGGTGIFVPNGFDSGGVEPSNVYAITIDNSTVRGGHHADGTATLYASSGGAGIELFESNATLKVLNNSLIQGGNGARQLFDSGGSFGGDSRPGIPGIFSFAAGEIIISDSVVSGGRGGDAGPENGVAWGGGEALFVGSLFETPGPLIVKLTNATIRGGDAGAGGGSPDEMEDGITLLRIVEGADGISAGEYIDGAFTLVSENSQISGGAGSDSGGIEPASSGGIGIDGAGNVTLQINSGSVVRGGAGGMGTAAFDGAAGGDGISIYGGGLAELKNSTVSGGAGGDATGSGTGGQGGLGTDTVDPYPVSEPNGPGVVKNTGSTVTNGANGKP